MRLTRRYHFSASHRLHSPDLTDAQNREIYGKCNNPHGHGHDYVLEVSVRGPVQESSGLVVNLAALDEYVNSRVVSDFQHRNMNTQIPVFETLSPTTENVAVEIRRRLREDWEEAFPNGLPRLETIKLFETRKNIIELIG